MSLETVKIVEGLPEWGLVKKGDHELPSGLYSC